MNPATHALVGMTLGRLTRHPGAAFGLGLLSHTVLDVLPHYDSFNLSWRLLDGALTLGIVAYACRSSTAELAGVIGAILPDLENMGEPVRPLFRDKHFPGHRTHHGTRVDFPSAFLEAGVVGAALLIGCAMLSRSSTARASGTGCGTRRWRVSGLACGRGSVVAHEP
jgi:hypothetical protein